VAGSSPVGSTKRNAFNGRFSFCGP